MMYEIDVSFVKSESAFVTIGVRPNSNKYGTIWKNTIDKMEDNGIMI